MTKLAVDRPYLDALPYQCGHDVCLSFWAVALDKQWIDFPPSAKVLEIGCAEADWQTPMLALRPDLHLVGVDWRPCVRPGVMLQTDVMQPAVFQPETFDAVVSVSAIEHIGLGAYDGDPTDPDGDSKVMRNAHRWLKRGGWLYLDVPYGNTFEVGEQYRRYNDAAVTQRLLPGFAVRHWAKCDVDHADSPYLALLLDRL